MRRLSRRPPSVHTSTALVKKLHSMMRRGKAAHIRGSDIEPFVGNVQKISALQARSAAKGFPPRN